MRGKQLSLLCPLFTVRLIFTHQSLFSLFCHFLQIIADFVTTQYTCQGRTGEFVRGMRKNAGPIKVLFTISVNIFKRLNGQYLL